MDNQSIERGWYLSCSSTSRRPQFPRRPPPTSNSQAPTLPAAGHRPRSQRPVTAPPPLSSALPHNLGATEAVPVSSANRSMNPIYENLNLEDPMKGAGVAAPSLLVASSGPGGSSGSGSSVGSSSAAPATQRKPGRMKRFPRFSPTSPGTTPVARVPKELPVVPSFRSVPPVPVPKELAEAREQLPLSDTVEVFVTRKGSKEDEAEEKRWKQRWLDEAKRLEERDDQCDTEEATAVFCEFKKKWGSLYRKLGTTRSEDVVFIYKAPSDTQEEHLTAEKMEMEADLSRWPVCSQAQLFATLALNEYNSTKRTCKFEMARVLLSKCFSEVDGTTFAHVNFTATATQQNASNSAKRLFFAELMFIPDRQLQEPMRVLHVCTIDDSCFGGCHEMVRDMKGSVRKDLDYDRCHACSMRIKHPRGAQFIAGHNRTRMPYVSVLS